jgi:hypothetical protein
MAGLGAVCGRSRDGWAGRGVRAEAGSQAPAEYLRGKSARYRGPQPVCRLSRLLPKSMSAAAISMAVAATVHIVG